MDQPSNVSGDDIMYTPRAYMSNSNEMFTPRSTTSIQEINQRLSELPNALHAANQAANAKAVNVVSEMKKALNAPIIKNEASNRQAAIQANAKLMNSTRNINVSVRRNESPIIIDDAAPIAQAVEHPAARLIENPIFIAKMFQIIGLCGANASSMVPNQQFNPLDITLIGGAVLTIYDHVLEEYRARKVGRLHRLRQYIQDATRDMDIVWHMTNAPNHVQVIPALTRAIGVQLADCLQSDLVKIQNLIEKEIKQPATVRIQRGDLVEAYGTYAIRVEVKLDGFPSFTICDCSIHDGYSSQKFNDHHRQFPRDAQGRIIPRPVGTDPTYCDQYNTSLFQIGQAYIRVPQLGRYTDQQLFAFGNLALHYDMAKRQTSMKNLKRILYLIRVLGVTNTQNWQNSRDLGKLILSDELNVQLFLNYLFLNTNAKINMILEEYDALRPMIIAVLHHFNLENVPMQVLGQNIQPVRETIKSLLQVAQERERMQVEEQAHIHAQIARTQMARVPMPFSHIPYASIQSSHAPMKGIPRRNGTQRRGGKNKRKTQRRH